jgi:hypothetical protein
MEGRRQGMVLEDWIDERITLQLHRGSAAEEGEETVEIPGFLKGVDQTGVFVQFYPDDVKGQGGVGRSCPSMSHPPWCFIRGGASSLFSPVTRTLSPRTSRHGTRGLFFVHPSVPEGTL